MAKRHDLASNGIVLTTALAYGDVRRIVELVASQSAGGDILRASAKVATRQSTDGLLVYDLRNGFNVTHLTFAVNFARLPDGRTRVHTEILSYRTSQTMLFYFIPLGPKTMLGHHTYSVFMRKLESTIRDADESAVIELALGPLRGLDLDRLAEPSTPDLASPVPLTDNQIPVAAPLPVAGSDPTRASLANGSVDGLDRSASSEDSGRKAGGIALVVVGSILVLIALVWGYAGFYASQAPVLLVLVGGGLALIFGGARVHRDRNPARTVDWRSVTTSPPAAITPDLVTRESEDSMTSCHSCGTPLREGAAHCGNCGAARPAVASGEVATPAAPVAATATASAAPHPPPVLATPPVSPAMPPGWPAIAPAPTVQPAPSTTSVPELPKAQATAPPVVPPPVIPPPPSPAVIAPVPVSHSSSSLVATPGSIDDATRIAPPRTARQQWTLTTPDGASRTVTNALVVGRLPSASAVVGDAETWKLTDPDGQISKSHAAFTVARGRLYVADLDSTNGVVVVSPDGTEMESRDAQRVEVLDGAEVELGGFVIAVSRGSS